MRTLRRANMVSEGFAPKIPNCFKGSNSSIFRQPPSGIGAIVSRKLEPLTTLNFLPSGGSSAFGGGSGYLRGHGPRLAFQRHSLAWVGVPGSDFFCRRQIAREPHTGPEQCAAGEPWASSALEARNLGWRCLPWWS